MRRLAFLSALALSASFIAASEPREENPLYRVENNRDGIKVFRLHRDKVKEEKDLLPATPKALSKLMAPGEFADVPEVALEEPHSKTATKEQAIEAMEYRFAKVNYFNLRGSDGFLKALIAQRPDLQGLPFRMGVDCQLAEEQAIALGQSLGAVRGAGDRIADADEGHYASLPAAVMQIWGPREKQAEIAAKLSTVPSVEATRALAKIAIFSPDAKAREIAAKGLKVRRDQDYTEILLAGLRYPWPAAAKRASEAIVRIDRKDLLAKLVDQLEVADPRLPTASGSETIVREMVRINHHRNCLLCHAPAHLKTMVEMPKRDGLHELVKEIEDLKQAEKRLDERDNLIAVVPLPNRSFDSERDGYRNDGTKDRIAVRVDVTYLRQDFSAMLPVEDAAPWPTYQRFDFLVRTRKVNADEAKAIAEKVQSSMGRGRISPYRRAVLFALRELTGREATDAAEWRRILQMP